MINDRKKVNKSDPAIITFNNRTRYEYFIIEELEAGLSLQGWEVKSLRAGKVSINDSYVILKNREAFLFKANFVPLTFASTHFTCDPIRNRKLLLHKREIDTLFGHVNRKSYTIVALLLFWKNSRCKIKIGVAKGKRLYDKRSNLRKREWQLDRAHVMKKSAINSS